ncbi:serine/threonine-protein kinase [Nocardioides sp. Kera G14]|uniref:serine/threonine-protein kinase n=1 Tax=Nocardioides sp. Kera G14 TaxID=2884264 RepID=UPI001D1270EC|nr:serine/threonine-protein kinase [Nocardioides sp. Kera G14]UDY23629.1 serine/threonine protein kinase [Nocardioides sp. Kera G14]
MSLPTNAHFIDDAERYRADSLIATGGMGEVWRGLDTVLDRPIAIKVLKREYAGDSIFRARFEAEARHAASISDPGIAAVWDVGQSLDELGVLRPFLVMELVDGQPLSALIQRGQGMDPEVVRDLMAQVGDALAAAHRAGIVHRDVKPANVLVTPSRKVKITDFGIARALSAMSLTGTGAVMGTPQYLSPEQARGEAATPASDVYGLGVMSYECLTGTRPFDKETAVATALAHLNDEIPPLPATVPADIAAVVMQALSKKPAARYADGAAFAAALRGHARVTPATGATATAATAVVPPVVAGAAAAAPDSPATQILSPVGAAAATGPTPAAAAAAAEEDEESRSTWAIVLTVLAVLLIALVGWLLLRGNDDDTPDLPTSSTPATSASAPTTGASSTTPSASPSTFDLDPSTYVGQNVDSVMADLRSLGLKPTSHRIANPGDEVENTVAAIDPSTDLTEGDAVSVAYYGPVPTTPTPTPTPTQATTSSAPQTSSAPTEQPSTTAPSDSSTPSAETSSPAARKETR